LRGGCERFSFVDIRNGIFFFRFCGYWERRGDTKRGGSDVERMRRAKVDEK